MFDGRRDTPASLKVYLFYISHLPLLHVCLLGNTTSQNGASCGQAHPNGNTMSIKHAPASDLLFDQAGVLSWRFSLVSLFYPCKGGVVVVERG